MLRKHTHLKRYWYEKDNTENSSPVPPFPQPAVFSEAVLSISSISLQRYPIHTQAGTFSSFFFFNTMVIPCFIFSLNICTLEIIPHVKNKQTLLLFCWSTWYSIPWRCPTWLTSPYLSGWAWSFALVNSAAVNNLLQMGISRGGIPGGRVSEEESLRVCDFDRRYQAASHCHQHYVRIPVSLHLYPHPRSVVIRALVFCQSIDGKYLFYKRGFTFLRAFFFSLICSYPS